ncbi:MAG TPA: M6 family metalloprotease domain-containing protein, partial [bacterium]|nr:M6 family metalloprotease domain-containing protein [bacterium]
MKTDFVRRCKILGLFTFSCCLGALLISQTAHAVIANPDPETLQQPNGVTFLAQQGGDEWLNWVVSDGTLIEKDSDGYWCYLAKSDKEPIRSKARVGMAPVPTQALSVTEFLQLESSQRRVPQGARIASENIAAPSGPTERILLILVSFNDRSITTSSSAWQNALFGTSGKTVRTYYNEVSKGAFYFVPAEETYGTANDGVVSVTLNRAHPNTADNTDDRNRQIVADALVAADPYVNFASFDTSGNGSISGAELHIVTIIAGYERAYSSTVSPSIWAHRWSLWGAVAPVTLDGKSVGGGGYTQQGELHGNTSGSHQATIGVLCHELGHDIGLPDLYDTDASNGDSYGIGIFGLMAGGSWGNTSGEYSGATPTHMCAWSKIAMGFVIPTVITSGGTQTLYRSNNSGYNVVRLNTSDTNQYFLIENRHTEGFDAGMYR